MKRLIFKFQFKTKKWKFIIMTVYGSMKYCRKIHEWFSKYDILFIMVFITSIFLQYYTTLNDKLKLTKYIIIHDIIKVTLQNNIQKLFFDYTWMGTKSRDMAVITSLKQFAWIVLVIIRVIFYLFFICNNRMILYFCAIIIWW